MIPYLSKSGIESEIIFEPECHNATVTPELPDLVERARRDQIDVVYFQKVLGADTGRQIQALRQAGVRTVLGLCDLVDAELGAEADAIVVVTDYLRSLFPAQLQDKIVVVHDGLENVDVFKSEYGAERGSRHVPLRAILVTSQDLFQLPVLRSPPDWLEVVIVGRYVPMTDRIGRLREVKRNLEVQDGLKNVARLMAFTLHPRITRIAWTQDGVYDEMLKADIGIIPIDRKPAHLKGAAPPDWKVKSQNRLTMKMAIGLPVIATPIPSYVPVVEQGENAFLAETREEWWRYLGQLRDPAERARIGTAARAHVLDTYSKARQAEDLIAVLRHLMA